MTKTKAVCNFDRSTAHWIVRLDSTLAECAIRYHLATNRPTRPIALAVVVVVVEHWPNANAVFEDRARRQRVKDAAEESRWAAPSADRLAAWRRWQNAETVPARHDKHSTKFRSTLSSAGPFDDEWSSFLGRVRVVQLLNR